MFKNKKSFLLIIAFTSGMSIMAVEITASRLLAPYFGTSLFVWTNIIGVVMIALALGYYFGGKLADRQPKLGVILKLILIAGVIFLIIPWVTGALAHFVSLGTATVDSASVVIFASSLFVTLILFAFPLVLLGMVSPFVIKLYSQHEKEIGTASGSVFAISTIGSIVGTFLPTLWLIAAVGTKVTITIFAVVLIVLTSFGLIIKKRYLLLLPLLLLPIIGISYVPIKASAGLVFEDESVYQYLQVIKEEDNNYLIYNEGGGVQSAYNENNILTGSMYYDYYAALPYLIDSDEKKALILGLAGGTISRQFDHYFAGEITIDGVEIDQKVIEAADKYFALRNDSLQVHNQDGRIFLQRTENKYDIIIVDAYQKQIYIPWTMTTREFWMEVKSKLTPTGVMAINVNAPAPDSQLLLAITNSIASVFDQTYVVKTGGEDSWNYMIMASQNELPLGLWPGLVPYPEIKSLAQEMSGNVEKVTYQAEEMILTDDQAPVEFLIDKMVVDYYLDSQQ